MTRGCRYPCQSALANLPLPICPCPSALAPSTLATLPLPIYPCPSALAHLPLPICPCPSALPHGNVYNVSQSDELAAIIPARFTHRDQLDSHNFVRDIVLVPNKGGVQRWIDDRHLLSDPLRFVFAFLSGMMGERPRIMKCVTIKSYNWSWKLASIF